MNCELSETSEKGKRLQQTTRLMILYWMTQQLDRKDCMKVGTFCAHAICVPQVYLMIIVHSGSRNPSQCGENYFHNELKPVYFGVFE